MLDKDKSSVATTQLDEDIMFATDDLLNAQDKADAAAEPAADEDEEIVIGEADAVDTTTDDTPDEAKDKFDGKSTDEIKAAYANLEKLTGRQGQELGDLRKKVAELESKDTSDPAKQDVAYTDADIPRMSDDVLRGYIEQYDKYLSTPGIQIEDADNYPIYNRQYTYLLLEQRDRMARKSAFTETVTVLNKQVAETYPSKNALTTEEMHVITDYAMTRLAEDGKITHSDLDVALHKKFPDKYVKLLNDKERHRISKAQTTTTPRLPAGSESNHPKVITPTQFANMSEDEQERIMERMSPTQLESLRRAINKT